MMRSTNDQPHLSLDANTFKAALPVPTSWLLADCMEFRGKQDLWTRQKPEILEALRERAFVQSVESSNRIEGVTIAPERLRPIVLGHARPRDRSEEELAGYRRALDWIFALRNRPTLDAATILHLHKLGQGGASADAGQFKSKDNEIIEFDSAGNRRVRFRPTSARQTPGAIDALCDQYAQMTDGAAAPPLLIISTFIFDFLCIHPFRDGNGRVSRLLTTLMLQQSGFNVARFVSLERLVEESKTEYYDVLGICSRGWIEGSNPILPWWNYFLTIVRRAYAEFAEKMENTDPRKSKSSLAGQIILQQVGPFTLADIKAQLPTSSQQLLRKVLTRLRTAKRVKLVGRGRGARWEVVRLPAKRRKS